MAVVLFAIFAVSLIPAMAHVVLAEEVDEGLATGTLSGLQRRPPLEEVDEHGSVTPLAMPVRILVPRVALRPQASAGTLTGRTPDADVEHAED